MGRKKKAWPPQPAENKEQMRVFWYGTWHNLGPKSKPAVWKAEYRRLLALWEVDPGAEKPRPIDYLVGTLCNDYLESDDSPADGPQRERVVTAVGLLLEHHVGTAVADFGPLALRTWQRWLCRLENPPDHHAAGQLRYGVNTVKLYVDVVRQIWKWGVGTERVPAEKANALATVPRPKVGEAKPPRIVEPANLEHVKATLPYLTPVPRSMVVLQLATGARPSEICKMTPGEVHRSGKVHVPGAGLQDLDALGVWCYLPTKHKNSWRQKPRYLMFVGEAQKVLEPYLDRDPGKPCFSPAESVALMREAQREAAKRKRGDRTGGSRKPVKGATGNRTPTSRYTARSYHRAVMVAASRAGVPHWYPYMLRHLKAAELKEVFDLDAVQSLLGQHSKSMAEHYGGVAFKRAAEVAKAQAGA
jgi:integrase